MGGRAAAGGLAPDPRAAGREIEERLIVEGDWTVASGERALYRMLEACPDIDAVFASNDQMALGVIHAAHQARQAVPEDISVVGVDNIAEASHFWPPLTTVHQPLGEAGVLAVKELDRLIERSRALRGERPEPRARDGRSSSRR